MINEFVEKEAADALLDIGASLPFIDFKLPFSKKKITLRLVMRRPCLGSQIRIAKMYLNLGVSLSKMKQFTKEEELRFLAEKGKHMSKIVSLTICRGAVSGFLFSGIVAWLLRWFVSSKYWFIAGISFMNLLGTKAFMTIIESVEASSVLKPIPSQEQEKGS